MNRKTPIYIALFVLFAAFIASPASAAWTTQASGKNTAYAFSDNAAPTVKLKAPYAGVEAWLGIGCSGGQEWAYVGFSETPKLEGTTEPTGYTVINAKVTWDGRAENVELRQDKGSPVLYFRDDSAVITSIARANAVTLDLNWQGQGSRSFDFSLKGSSAALLQMRRACGGR